MSGCTPLPGALMNTVCDGLAIAMGRQTRL
jgi:hypothetical protein